MKKFNIVFIVIFILLLVGDIAVNLSLTSTTDKEDREYIVQVERLSHKISDNKSYNLDDYPRIISVEKSNTASEEFVAGGNNDYVIRKINNKYYRFEYEKFQENIDVSLIAFVNIIFALIIILVTVVMIYIKQMVLKPFNQLKDVPYELSRGNLTVPVKENKNRLFGKFIWGIDLLREYIEEQKTNQLKLQKDKKTLIMSISHDIKTPLSAIKLSSKALSKGLYNDREKQIQLAENIDAKANEIEKFVSEIIKASNEDFIKFKVENSEFYLKQLIEEIKHYYNEKMDLNKTEFIVDDFSNCLVKGDLNRSIEVIQNIIENALKYGDGKWIKIAFSEEEGCQLIEISNSGSKISDAEFPHIFDSFWRGGNSENVQGSGLGLYICRQLMNLMNGEIFALIQGDIMSVTLVFQKP